MKIYCKRLAAGSTHITANFHTEQVKLRAGARNDAPASDRASCPSAIHRRTRSADGARPITGAAYRLPWRRARAQRTAPQPGRRRRPTWRAARPTIPPIGFARGRSRAPHARGAPEPRFKGRRAAWRHTYHRNYSCTFWLTLAFSRFFEFLPDPPGPSDRRAQQSTRTLTISAAHLCTKIHSQ